MDGYWYFRKDKTRWRDWKLPLKVKDWEHFPLEWLMSQLREVVLELEGSTTLW